MKIVTQTPTEIVFTDSRNSLWWVPVVLILVGLYIAYNSISTPASPLLSIACIALGILPLLLSQKQTVHINKNAQSITIQKKSLLKKKITTYETGEVSEIHLVLYPQYSSQPSVNNINVSKLMMMSQLNLYMKNGNSVPLEKATGSMTTIGVTTNDNAQQDSRDGLLLATFLEVPFQTIAPGSSFVPKV